MSRALHRLALAVLANVAAVANMTVSGQPTEDGDRYSVRDPLSLTVPRKPVTRKDYVDFVRPEARGFESGPDRGQYGPRHALPALAVFSLEGDRGLGEGIKKTLRHYADWVQASIDKEQGVFSMEGATLCALHFRELRKAGLIRPEDEAWIRRLFLNLRKDFCTVSFSRCQVLIGDVPFAYYTKRPTWCETLVASREALARQEAALAPTPGRPIPAPARWCGAGRGSTAPTWHVPAAARATGRGSESSTSASASCAKRRSWTRYPPLRKKGICVS